MAQNRESTTKPPAIVIAFDTKRICTDLRLKNIEKQGFLKHLDISHILAARLVPTTSGKWLIRHDVQDVATREFWKTDRI
jgi:hypothetical protein